MHSRMGEGFRVEGEAVEMGKEAGWVFFWCGERRVERSISEDTAMQLEVKKEIRYEHQGSSTLQGEDRETQ